MRTKVRATLATLNFLNIKSVLAFPKKGEEKNMSEKMKFRFRFFTSAILAVLFFSV